MLEIIKNPPATNEQEEIELIRGNARARVTKEKITLSVEGSQIAKAAWKAIHGMPQEPGQSG